MARLKIVLLFSLSILFFILAGFEMVDYKKETAIITLKKAHLVKIQDDPDTEYANLTVTEKGKTYHLVIHDIYIDHELLFEGYDYMFKYRNHQFLRPDKLIQTID